MLTETVAPSLRGAPCSISVRPTALWTAADAGIGRHRMFAIAFTLVPGAPPADLVTSLPGFESGWPFKVYSGYLHVPGPFKLNPYDSLSIHYQLHTSQRDPSTDPLVTWHQGGPGGSSIDVGLYTEMGYFRHGDQGSFVNPYAWNRVANMLYLESPAGSGQKHGYSECLQGEKPVPCHWDDVSQAEAYAHALAAFKRAFPELAPNDLYLTGESYFGQYGPNIAQYILTTKPFNTSLGLMGIAAGNACWGGAEDKVDCNGPNAEQNDVDMFYGKGLVSKKLYQATYAACGDPFEKSLKCEIMQEKVAEAVGPHNIYNIYDNCLVMASDLAARGKSMRWAKQQLRAQLGGPGLPPKPEREAPHGTGGGVPADETGGVGRLDEAGGNGLADEPDGTGGAGPADEADVTGAAFPPAAADGGFTWACGGEAASDAWIERPDVRAALHLREAGRSSFSYRTSGPASVTLWPFLSTKLRILIYNGDADACVPYKGNEEWVGNLEAAGVLAQKEAWRPWYASHGARAPAGYVTTYTPKAAKDFSFLTVRLAGHMVPTYQPEASLAFLTRFLDGRPF